MTDAAWAPLSRRIAGLGPDLTVHDGVPPYLRGALENWVHDCYPDDQYEGSALDNTLKFRLRLTTSPRPPTRLTDDELLDVIDALLAWCVPEDSLLPGETSWLVGALREILTTGGAGWRITNSGKGLERRIDTTVTAAVFKTIHSANDEAGSYLATAWTAAYGRNPDPDKAYDEAVLAVEAVSCPLVCPKNTRRTLGTVISDLRKQSTQWELALGDTTGQPAGVERLVGMLALLWEGQSRHAGSPNARRQTQAEGEAAVHLAATLVQWLTSGVLHRKP